jgi:hypothetical protein
MVRNAHVGRPEKVPLLAQPRKLEAVGIALAAQLRTDALGAVVCWDYINDAVLAHVVARELGLDVWHTTIDEGLVTLHRPLPEGATVILVAERFDMVTATIAALSGIVVNRGGRIAALVSPYADFSTVGTAAEHARIVTVEES